MWPVLGVPGQPSGQSANAHWSSGTASPRGMSGELGFGESLGNTYSSACACALSLDTAGEGFKGRGAPPRRRNGFPPLKVGAGDPGRDGFPDSPAIFFKCNGEINRQG